jgi:hypothetical protein
MPKTVQEMLTMQMSDVEHRAAIFELTDTDLDAYILSQGNARYNAIAVELRNKRRFDILSKPHWSLKWGFIVAFLAMVFAGIAAWPIIQSWIQSSSPSNKAASFQPPQSNSESATSPVLKIAEPSTNAAQTNILNR